MYICKCRKCSKCVHFQNVCHSTVNVGVVRREYTDTFLGIVESQDSVSNLWELSVILNNTPTDFDIDTGAEVSLISEEQYKKIGSPTLSAKQDVERT